MNRLVPSYDDAYWPGENFLQFSDLLCSIIWFKLLLPAYVVCGKVMFSVLFVYQSVQLYPGGWHVTFHMVHWGANRHHQVHYGIGHMGPLKKGVPCNLSHDALGSKKVTSSALWDRSYGTQPPQCPGTPQHLGTPHGAQVPPQCLGTPPQHLGTPHSAWVPPTVPGYPQRL